MPYTVRQLVTKAWYLSGIVSRELQTVSGAQITEGVDLLNALLAIKTANSRLIPYYSQPFNVTLVTGQEKYYVPNLISVETLTFFIGTIRYSMLETDRVTYFGSPRVNDITALPYNWHLERTLGGANIFIYFLPADTLNPLQLVGKFSLGNVTVDQDLLLTLDQFYVEYLRYALTEYICNDYNISVTPQTANKLAEYEQVITDISSFDFTIQKQSTLQQSTSINYGDVNLGKGWRP